MGDPFARRKEVIEASRARTEPLKVMLKVALQTSYGERLFVSGSIKPLGSWNEARTRRMDFDEGAWRTTFEVDKDVQKLEYRYQMVHDASKNMRWEKGPVRSVDIPRDHKGILELDDMVMF